MLHEQNFDKMSAARQICLTRRLWRRIAALCLPVLLAVGLLWQGWLIPPGCSAFRKRCRWLVRIR